MGKKILILVATMSGTAEMVASELADSLKLHGWDAELFLMSEVQASVLLDCQCCLFCVSTYGVGELPDNGKEFYVQLQVQRPNLSSLHYGVVGLGDSNYPLTFCKAGRELDELLQSLEGVRIGARFEHDRRAPGYPEEAALNWLPEWLAALATVAAKAEAV